MNEEKIDLLPRIIWHSNSNQYTAYIPYEISFDVSIENCNNTYSIACFLGLPTNRSNYSPSYSYQYNDKTFEVGIAGTKIDRIYDAIRQIQEQLIKKNCKVDVNLEKIMVQK
jgi:thymidylate synthase